MKMSGIYTISNLLTRKIYVGSAANIYHRWGNHRSDLKNSKHHSPYLQRAWNKHGEENFKFEVLATCPKEYLIKMEQFFIDKIKPEYNISKTAGSPLGVKHTEKAKTNMSIAKKNSEISKSKLREIQVKNRKAIYQYDLAGFFIKKHESAVMAAQSIGVKVSQISKAALNSGGAKTGGGFQFRYTFSEKIESVSSKIYKVAAYKDGELIGAFMSLKECGSALGIWRTGLSAHLRGLKNYPRVGGYTAKRITDIEYQQINTGS